MKIGLTRSASELPERRGKLSALDILGYRAVGRAVEAANS